MKSRIQIVAVCLIGLMLSLTTAQAQQQADGFQGTNAATINYFMGKVGVGTTTPAVGLQVNSALRALGAVDHTAQGVDRLDVGVQDGSPRIIFEDTGYNRWGIDNYLGMFRWWVSPTSGAASVALVLDSGTGNLGVGTMTPAEKLHVAGSLKVDGPTTFSASLRAAGPVDHTSQGVDRLDVGVEAGTPRIILEDTGYNRWGIDNLNGSFRWWVSPTSGAASVAMVIESDSGRVGIGTSSPQADLHVAGSAMFDNGITGPLRALGPVDHTAQGVDRLDVGVQDGSPRIIFEDTGFNRWGVDNVAGAFRWWTSRTNATADVLMSLDSDSGNVGIGVTPLAKLHVAGAARFDGGITYIPPMGDLSMGSFTNAP